MSLFGIGVDLCDISRIERSLEKHGARFAEKILHPKESAIFERHKFPARFLAKRFAAKEACAKALGTGIAEGVIMPDIEVSNDARGKPVLRLHGVAKKRVDELSLAKLHLSISDEKHYAIAQVMIECQ